MIKNFQIEKSVRLRRVPFKRGSSGQLKWEELTLDQPSSVQKDKEMLFKVLNVSEVEIKSLDTAFCLCSNS